MDGEETTAQLWTKLEKLVFSKSLPNKIYLNERFLGYRMDSTKNLDENLNEFNKICLI